MNYNNNNSLGNKMNNNIYCLGNKIDSIFSQKNTIDNKPITNNETYKNLNNNEQKNAPRLYNYNNKSSIKTTSSNLEKVQKLNYPQNQLYS